MSTTRIQLFGVAVAALLGGCGNDIDPTPFEDDELTPPDCTVRGPRMIRRLTAAQIRNTLQHAFRDPNVPVGDTVADPVVRGFKIDATHAVVRDLDAQLIMSYAESVADWAATQKLGQLSSCQSMDAACVRAFVETLGERLHREPVPPDAVDAYAAMFAAEATFADGARAVIATMIQSPSFLYRRELGVERDGLYVLTPYELASSLSYMLTNFPPDDALLDAAEQGRLATRADLDREVDRLLAKPEAEVALGLFTRSWLEVDDLLSRAKLDPQNRLTEQIRTAMLEETVRLFVHVLRSGAPIGELFTARYTFLDQQLAGYYGLGGAGGGFQQVPLPPDTRGLGLLGHGSVLTRHALADTSSPVQRGKLVRERLLCEHLTPPPPSVDTNLPPPQGVVTTRQRYEAHTAAEACRSCHHRIDPVGFAFERFDAFGRRRDQDNGLPIDATGELTDTPDGTIALDGIDSVASYLGRSAQAAACVVEYASYFSYGLDGCSTAEIAAELAAGDGSLKSVIRAIVHAPQFTTRTAD